MSDHWAETNVPDQTGKHILITGATGGLGLSQARQLAREGAPLTLAVRGPGKGWEAVKAICSQPPETEIALHDPDLAAALWEISQQRTGVNFP